MIPPIPFSTATRYRSNGPLLPAILLRFPVATRNVFFPAFGYRISCFFRATGDAVEATLAVSGAEGDAAVAATDADTADTADTDAAEAGEAEPLTNVPARSRPATTDRTERERTLCVTGGTTSVRLTRRK
ncbi:hypothetical protein [Kineosporia succinea]|uniref:Uncharacterized protein n=1 Tax=Kineosporia succinea TaxID=84632 RepID=A0ABT9PB65_9ACTN|nr:hypothetical protein [Kineosporia succinea]MDP9829930.1 hypothetical protein [Kineosporia succinea]